MAPSLLFSPENAPQISIITEIETIALHIQLCSLIPLHSVTNEEALGEGPLQSISHNDKLGNSHQT